MMTIKSFSHSPPSFHTSEKTKTESETLGRMEKEFSCVESPEMEIIRLVDDSRLVEPSP